MMIKRRPISVFCVERNRTSGKSGQTERRNRQSGRLQRRSHRSGRCRVCRRRFWRRVLFFGAFLDRRRSRSRRGRRGSAARADRLLLGVVAQIAVLLWRGASARAVLQNTVLKRKRDYLVSVDLNYIYLSTYFVRVGVNCSNCNCSTRNCSTLFAGKQLLNTNFINCSNPVNPG